MGEISGHDAYELLKRIRMDLSAAQAKITDLQNMLGQLNLKNTTRPNCPECGLSLKNSSALEEHLYHQHNGPTPTSWEKAERMSV